MPNNWRALRGATGVSTVIRWVPWLAMARALGGRAGTDRAPVHRDATRLVAFSDAVFAITVTLLVLEIRPPTDYRNLLHGLLAVWPSYLAYGVTFLFIGQVWANHHVMFDHIRAADRVVLLLNTLLLMAVAFLPFATSVLAGALRSGHGQRTAVVFYGIAFALTALTFNAVWQYACRHRLLSEALDSAGATAIGRRFQLALAWLATGALFGALLSAVESRSRDQPAAGTGMRLRARLVRVAGGDSRLGSGASKRR
jgi:TMEM175 potassium channel family protein